MKIPEGYRWFNGVVMNAAHTKIYNDWSEEVELAERNYPDRPDYAEWLKNLRARWLHSCFAVYLPEVKK